MNNLSDTAKYKYFQEKLLYNFSKQENIYFN